MDFPMITNARFPIQLFVVYVDGIGAINYTVNGVDSIR